MAFEPDLHQLFVVARVGAEAGQALDGGRRAEHFGLGWAHICNSVPDYVMTVF